MVYEIRGQHPHTRPMKLHELTFSEIRDGLSAGTFSARDLVESAIDRIESVDSSLNAFIRVREREDALAEAGEIDAARVRGGKLGPLAGIPVAVKDNISTRGLGTTCASRILAGYDPPYDATAVERLRDAGAIVVGKTNLDEFAMGSSNENSAYGPVRNPWDSSRVPGGSSGGSAAAVAAGEVVLALGTDTGGSVRQPAGFCGIVGVKPSYGRVSRYGLVAFASSFDQIGTMSRDVEGAGELLAAISGADPRDATASEVDVPQYTGPVTGDLRGVRIGIPQELIGKGVDAEVAEAVQSAADAMRSLGADVDTLSLEYSEHGVASYYLIADAEASSNLARYDGVKYGHRALEADSLDEVIAKTRSEGFGAEVKRRIMLGTYALAAGYYDDYYLRAQRVRSLIVEDFTRAFERFDAIMTPTSPTPAFHLGEHVNDPLAMYLSDVFTVLANLAGIAALSMPCGLSSAGLPIGLQIMVDRFMEPTMFRIAREYEAASDLRLRAGDVNEVERCA
jgi:aspartyl-tRNA(Asn)/glutamyl-tRNA(Gln) amidotransferase subunit A